MGANTSAIVGSAEVKACKCNSRKFGSAKVRKSRMSIDVDADFTKDLIYNKTAAIKGGVLYGCYCNQKD